MHSGRTDARLLALVCWRVRFANPAALRAVAQPALTP
jgi:hypothetical protein